MNHASRLITTIMPKWVILRISHLISQKVLIKSLYKSQSPYEFVNLFFIQAMLKDKLTDLCGDWLSQNDLTDTSMR